MVETTLGEVAEMWGVVELREREVGRGVVGVVGVCLVSCCLVWGRRSLCGEDSVRTHATQKEKTPFTQLNDYLDKILSCPCIFQITSCVFHPRKGCFLPTTQQHV